MIRAEQEASKKSSVSWLKTVLKSGTVADKTAALVLMVQEAPLHNLPSIDSLLAMVKRKGARREVLPILGQKMFTNKFCDCRILLSPVHQFYHLTNQNVALV